MALALLDKCIWEIEVDPVIWLLGQVEFAWNAHLIIGENFIEILLPAVRVRVLETELLDFSLVLIVELDSIQSLIGLLPHFHDKEVSIQSVFSLLVAVWGNHCEHGMDAD